MATQIDPDGTTTKNIQLREDKLQHMQEIVGGLIQVLELGDGKAMVIDEEGKLKGYEINYKATEMCINFDVGLSSWDMIVGTALIVQLGTELT